MPDKKTRTKGQPNRPGKVTSKRGQSGAPKQGGKPRPQKTKTAAGISADSKVIDKDTKIKIALGYFVLAALLASGAAFTHLPIS